MARRTDAHLAARGRVQVADAGGEGVVTVQRLAEGVQRQRLHVVFDIRPRLLARRAREAAELRRRHAHRPAALEQVLQPDAGLAPPRVGHRVERAHAIHTEHRAHLQMVLQVLADAGQRMLHRNAVRLQQGGRPDARQLQQLRRADGAAGEQHLARGACHQRRTTALRLRLDAHGAQRTVVIALEQHTRDMRTGPHLQVGPLLRRAQKGLGRIPADAGALVDLEIADTLVVAAVEVFRGRDAGLLRGLRERIEDLPRQPLLLDAPFAAGPRTAGVETGRGMHLVGAAPVVLVAQEVRHAVLPTPRIVTGELRPLVVVARLAAHVDHAVDAGAAAEHLAARIAQRAAVQPGVRVGTEQPVGARIADAVEVTHRHVDPQVIVVAAGLDQQHALPRIGTQPIGEQAAGGAGADDDVVVCGV